MLSYVAGGFVRERDAEFSRGEAAEEMEEREKPFSRLHRSLIRHRARHWTKPPATLHRGQTSEAFFCLFSGILFNT